MPHCAVNITAVPLLVLRPLQALACITTSDMTLQAVRIWTYLGSFEFGLI